MLVRGPVSLFQLPEDLRLAEHQRVQSAGDREDMLDRLATFELIERVAQVETMGGEVVPVSEPLHQRIASAVRETVHLGAIAGGDDHGLANAWRAVELTQRFGQLFVAENHFLADLDRSCTMIDADDDECHVRCRERAGIVREPLPDDNRRTPLVDQQIFTQGIPAGVSPVKGERQACPFARRQVCSRSLI